MKTATQFVNFCKALVYKNTNSDGVLFCATRFGIFKKLPYSRFLFLGLYVGLIFLVTSNHNLWAACEYNVTNCPIVSSSAADNKISVCTPSANYLSATQEYELSVNCTTICATHKNEINVSYETSDGHFVGGSIIEPVKVSFQSSGTKTVWVYMYRKGKPIEIDKFIINIPEANVKSITNITTPTITINSPGFEPYIRPLPTFRSTDCTNMPEHYLPGTNPVGENRPFYIVPVTIITDNKNLNNRSIKFNWDAPNFLLHEILINGKRIAMNYNIFIQGAETPWFYNHNLLSSANFRNDWQVSYINLKGTNTSKRLNIEYVFKRVDDIALSYNNSKIQFVASIVQGQGGITQLSTDSPIAESLLTAVPHDPCFVITPWRICSNCSNNDNRKMFAIPIIYNDAYGAAQKVVVNVHINKEIDPQSIQILSVSNTLGDLPTISSSITSGNTVLTFEFNAANLWGVNFNVFKQIGGFAFRYDLCAPNNMPVTTRLQTFLYTNATDTTPSDSAWSDIATTMPANAYAPFEFIPWLAADCNNCNCGSSGKMAWPGENETAQYETDEVNTTVENYMYGLFGKADAIIPLEGLQETQVALAPNPTKDYLRVYYNWVENQTYTLTLYDMYGQQVTDKLTQTAYISHLHQDILDINHLPKGMYILRITDGTQAITKKVLKE